MTHLGPADQRRRQPVIGGREGNEAAGTMGEENGRMMLLSAVLNEWMEGWMDEWIDEMTDEWLELWNRWVRG